MIRHGTFRSHRSCSSSTKHRKRKSRKGMVPGFAVGARSGEEWLQWAQYSKNEDAITSLKTGYAVLERSWEKHSRCLRIEHDRRRLDRLTARFCIASGSVRITIYAREDAWKAGSERAVIKRERIAMAFKSLQCPNCLGQIDTFDETTKIGTCPYCHSVIRDVADLQKRFEVTISGTVKVEGIDGAEDQLERAIGFVRLGELGEAEKLLDQYTAKYPMDFEGWRKLYELSKASLDKCGINPNDDALCFASDEALDKMITFDGKQKKALRCIKNMATLVSDDEQRLWIERERAEFVKKRDEKNILVDCMDSKIADMESKAKSLASKVKREEANCGKAQKTLRAMERKKRDGTIIVVGGVACAVIGITLSGSSGLWFQMMLGGFAIGAFVSYVILLGAISSANWSVEESYARVRAARQKEDKARSEISEVMCERSMEVALQKLYGQAVNLLEKA